MRTSRNNLLLILAIVAFSIILRCNSLDHGSSFHPDERHIVMTLEKMSWDNLNPNFFAYGSVPFYLAFFSSRVLAEFTSWHITYDNLFLLGRTISLIFGVASILLTGLITLQTFQNRRAALLAAALISCNVLHLQLSRFFAFDIILTTLATATLSAALLVMKRNYRLGLPLCGVFLGLALATKISALSLLAPIGFSIACAHQWDWRRVHKGAAQLLFVGVLGLVVFALTEPYAFIQWDLFQKQNLEQINMTQGNWRPPYTIQYWNTTPWIYPLEQMARWSFWWPAFLTAIFGVFAAVTARKRDHGQEKWLLLVWIGVSFLSIGGLQVKFPRYLLPIYPALYVFAGWFLDSLASWAAARSTRSLKAPTYYAVTLLVLLPSIAFAWAFRGIYNRPHSYVSASHWLYQNAPRGSAIVGFHWDDKIPLTLPGFSPGNYDYKVDNYELRIYELPDSHAKLEQMAEVLEKADYLAWPTPRINGSLPRVPDEYPRSLKLLHSLYNGALGFQLVHTEKVRPSLFGFEWRSDTLDESFSVYDHPKVMIFKKITPLSATQIADRVETALSLSPASLSRDEFLSRDADSPSAGTVTGVQSESQLFPILIWLLLIEALAFFCWPVLALIFPNAPDRGYLLSKSAGVLFFGLLSWGLASVNAIHLTSSGLLLVVAIIAISGITALSRERGLYYALSDIVRDRGFTVEVLLLTATLLLMVIKAFQPEIFWGEKPMDFGMLNYFLRIDQLPPEDPWAAGHQLQYYYLGTFIIAMLIKLSGMSAGIGFNLGLVLIAVLTISGACAILSCFTRRLWLAVGASAVFFLASNIQVILTWYSDTRRSFDLFWDSSRVFHSPAFAEYPLWSFLFGDLHAHVITYPFTLLLAGIGIYLVREWFFDERSPRLVGAALYGIVLGSLFALNTWDCISYSLFSVLLFSAALFPNQRHIQWLTFGERLRLIAMRAATAVAAMCLIVVPYSRSATSRVALHWGAVDMEEFNSTLQLLKFNGHWYLLLVLATVSIFGLYTLRFRRHFSPVRLALVAVTTLLPLILTLLARCIGADGTPWPAVAIASSLIASSTLLIIFPIRRPEAVLIALCGTAAAVILAGAECFFLFDRMNTIFKFYSALGTLVSLAALGALLYLTEEIQELPYRIRNRWIWASPVLGTSAVIIVVTLISASIITHAMTTFRRFEPVVRPTLDGTAYLSQTVPEEDALYRWMNSQIPGTPIMLEAQGPSYQQFNRVQMNTGLPVLVGWEHHIRQRGVSDPTYRARVEAVKTIYRTTDPAQAEQLASQFGVELIVIGYVERQTYPAEGLEKFSAPKSGFFKLWEYGKTVVYAPRSSRFHPEYRRRLKPHAKD